MTSRISWDRMLTEMPLIAILRGIAPPEVLAVAAILKQAGFLCLEVPLNSPDPLASIRRLRDHFGGQLAIGAGTIVSEAQVAAVQHAGAEFVVSPHASPSVIRATKARGLASLPGVATATEAFAAVEAGADALKLFPAEAAPPRVLQALKSVLPSSVPVFPVGGITPGVMKGYVDAGAAGFGIGSALYKPGLDFGAVCDRAIAFVDAWHELRKPAANP
ncbi:MAG TPA: 2-dehydro-3-deoxy-6-phosphogalactonate aldolase [Alphaproteobacteria bacterium]|nr:2-dehydro-3-deoxy-6-phosphogalactonate aldolase [Alphaproteobacteria bacterium]